MTTSAIVERFNVEEDVDHGFFAVLVASMIYQLRFECAQETVRWNKPEAIPLLLQAGASLEATNGKGDTPLDIAAKDEIKQLLQQ